MPAKTNPIFDMDDETTRLGMEIDLVRVVIDRVRDLGGNAEKYLGGRQDKDLPHAVAMLEWQMDRVADCRERIAALVTVGFEQERRPAMLKVVA